jgi:hypothetical protein
VDRPTESAPRPQAAVAFVAAWDLRHPEINTSRRLLGSRGAARVDLSSRCASPQLYVKPRHVDSMAPFELKRAGSFILGSDDEWSAATEGNGLANGVVFRYDLDSGYFWLQTSLVGLPPVFLYDDGAKFILASDIWSLRAESGIRLDFDPRAVAELATVGHPLDLKTLFRNVTIVPAGSIVETGAPGEAPRLRSGWRLPEPRPEASWRVFTDLQISAFREALDRIDLSSSVFSLTGGLDTRTILASLVEADRSLPAVTMSWREQSLDARIARRLCRAYRFPHETIAFDESLESALPRLAMEAARLSGGLTSVAEATEVAFYRHMGERWGARLSGYMGNQVGRGGVERISPRNADQSIVGERYRLWRTASAGGLSRTTEPSLTGLVSEQLQRELLCSSVANYSIGNHYMVQQSPFASRRLLETLSLLPDGGADRARRSSGRLRWRDFRHRVLGEREARSFQRRLIREVGGAVATYPINWGWRADGPPSLRGLGLGALSFCDALVVRTGRDHGALEWVCSTLALTGRDDFRRLRRWCTREFFEDILHAREIRESGVLDAARVQRMLDEHFVGTRDHLGSLVFATDLACAYEVFVGSRE